MTGKYFLTFIDEATRYAVVTLLTRKSETAARVKQLIAWAETQTDLRVQSVRHDRGGEFLEGELQLYYAQKGIQMEPTAAYSAEANGIAERFNLTILDMSLPMIAGSGDAASITCTPDQRTLRLCHPVCRGRSQRQACQRRAARQHAQ